MPDNKLMSKALKRDAVCPLFVCKRDTVLYGMFNEGLNFLSKTVI